jgi:hypothetical protein
MPTYQVTCISRDGPDPDFRIDAIGFAGNVYPIDNVIAWLQQSNDNQLLVTDNAGNTVYVAVRQHPVSGRLFLETYPDGIRLDNLAALPECP